MNTSPSLPPEHVHVICGTESADWNVSLYLVFGVSGIFRQYTDTSLYPAMSLGGRVTMYNSSRYMCVLPLKNCEG